MGNFYQMKKQMLSICEDNNTYLIAKEDSELVQIYFTVLGLGTCNRRCEMSAFMFFVYINFVKTCHQIHATCGIMSTTKGIN